jgi:hypothetical protein
MSGGVIAVLGPVWAGLAVVILVSGLRAGRSPQALRTGCLAVSALWLLAGAGVNAGMLVAGRSYSGFADGAALAFVHETWESLVVAHQAVFIGLLIAFEAVAGVLVLFPGRPRQAALLAVIAFTVALVSFGWGFLLWSVPVTAALVLLLRAERRRAAASTGTREMVTTS